MTRTEQAYFELCFAVWQKGMILAMERYAAQTEAFTAMVLPEDGSEARARRARASFYVVRN